MNSQKVIRARSYQKMTLKLVLILILFVAPVNGQNGNENTKMQQLSGIAETNDFTTDVFTVPNDHASNNDEETQYFFSSGGWGSFLRSYAKRYPKRRSPTRAPKRPTPAPTPAPSPLPTSSPVRAVSKSVEKKSDVKVPDVHEAKTVKELISKYFEDVRELEALCDMFVEQYNVDVCEMDGGKRRDNRRGFFEEAPHELLPFEEHEKWPEILLEAAINSNHTEERGLVDFNKEVMVLFATGNKSYNWYQQYQNVKKAFIRLRSCFEHTIQFRTRFMTQVKVNVSGMNWMKAIYEIMKAYEEQGRRGGKLSRYYKKEKMEIKKKGIYGGPNFSMDKNMLMIVLPDDVEFDGAYGFGILHNGLSIIKASHTASARDVLHEIGHNLGMRHSSTPDGGEYGDERCIMGSAKDDNVCFNGHKSAFLKLHRSLTSYVYDKSSIFYGRVFQMHDAQKHRKDKKVYGLTLTHRKYGPYRLIIALYYRENGTGWFYLMYYSDKDVITATEGKTGKIEGNGEVLKFADTSQVVFNLEKDESKVYRGVLVKRCGSKGPLPKVIISYDINTTCK